VAIVGGGIARAASPYGPPGGGIVRAASPYGPPTGRPVSPYQPGAAPIRSASPYYGGGGANPGVYPPGHVMEGRPIPGARGNIGRAPSPAPPGMVGGSPVAYTVGGVLPQQQSQQMLPAPEGFSRPPNRAQSYTPFETLKIQDMDDFFDNVPRMPQILLPHDVYHEDWIRFSTDLGSAWAGKLPVPQYAQDGGAPRRTTLTADLIDLWNASFFLGRGVEIVLYKGRERRSGRLFGQVDVHLPGFEGYDSEGHDSDDDDDDDYEDSKYGAYGGVYSRVVGSQMAELQQARRIRQERNRAEKKRRRQDKRYRRPNKGDERIYALYVTYIPPQDNPSQIY